MNHIHLATDKITKPKPFKTHYWQELYISEDRLELVLGITTAFIYPDGTITFNSNLTMPVVNLYHLINEAMAVYIYFYGGKARAN